VGGWPPTECRAGDESFGHDSPPDSGIPDIPTMIWSYLMLHIVVGVLSGIPLRGGGKCPDEERST
jgi:hypothetical protein